MYKVRPAGVAAAEGNGGDAMARGSMVPWIVLFRCCGFLRKRLRHPRGPRYRRPESAAPARTSSYPTIQTFLRR